MTYASDRSLLDELHRAVHHGEAVAVATVVGSRRSVPRRAGAKMLVFRDGRQRGTVGGGEMEARVVRACLDALADGHGRLLDYALVDPRQGDPGVCGGDVSIYVEPYMPEPVIYVVGCGHVGRAVVDLAHWMGFRVVATDDRPELADPAQLPHADVVVPGTITEALSTAPVTADTHVVVVTRNVPLDVEILPALLATPARTIGVMGSERRWRTTREALAAAGVPAEQLDRVLAPIGLEIDAETPEEIAVSVLAQIIQLRRSPAAP